MEVYFLMSNNEKGVFTPNQSVCSNHNAFYSHLSTVALPKFQYIFLILKSLWLVLCNFSTDFYLACLVYGLNMFVKKTDFLKFWFACLVYGLSCVWATVGKRVIVGSESGTTPPS